MVGLSSPNFGISNLVMNYTVKIPENHQERINKPTGGLNIL